MDNLFKFPNSIKTNLTISNELVDVVPLSQPVSKLFYYDPVKIYINIYKGKTYYSEKDYNNARNKYLKTKIKNLLKK